MPAHSICHIEWSSTDLVRAKAFYGGLFDWKFEPWGDDYVLFSPPDGVGGGIAKTDKVVPGEHPPVFYVLVDEIEPYLEKAKDVGGRVNVPKSELPNMGWYAVLADPDGNAVGLFQSKPKE